MCSTQGKYSSNLFIHVAAKALQTDVLIRLIRIFEDGEAASFWYLHRCEPRKIAEGIDIAKLQDFSRRLTLIRDKVFVHIDKDAVSIRRRPTEMRPSERGRSKKRSRRCGWSSIGYTLSKTACRSRVSQSRPSTASLKLSCAILPSYRRDRARQMGQG